MRLPQLRIQVSWPSTAPRGCGTCAHADIAVRGDDVVRECHLLPPTTMPDDEEADPWGSVAATEPDDDFPSFAGMHRYPVVTETDWCSHHKET